MEHYWLVWRDYSTSLSEPILPLPRVFHTRLVPRLFSARSSASTTWHSSAANTWSSSVSLGMCTASMTLQHARRTTRKLFQQQNHLRRRRKVRRILDQFCASFCSTPDLQSYTRCSEVPRLVTLRL